MLSPIDCIMKVATSEYELTFRQAAVLLQCSRTTDEVERQVRTLGSSLGFSRAVISRAADKLVDFKFVSRSELPGDRRTCVLSVTREGHRFIQTILGEPETASPKRRRETAAKALSAAA